VILLSPLIGYNAKTMLRQLQFVCAAALMIGFSLEANSMTAAKEPNSPLDFTVENIDGHPTNLEQFRGKVVLIVNVASKCGFTPQYAGLEALYKKYQDHGFVIIGFPANNFHSQEPGTNAQISQFCTSKYGVTFPMMAKISVKGPDKAPLYRYLTEKPTAKFPGEITWNFNKFLIGRDGHVVARFGSPVKPSSKKLVEAVESALANKQ
jgi:glutathione peroxidase